VKILLLAVLLCLPSLVWAAQTSTDEYRGQTFTVESAEPDGDVQPDWRDGPPQDGPPPDVVTPIRKAIAWCKCPVIPIPGIPGGSISWCW